MWSLTSCLIVLFVSLCFSGTASAQINALIRMSGVPGNSQVSGFYDWVEVSSFAVSADYMGGGVDFRPLQVSKLSNETDAKIFEVLAKHSNVKEVCVLSYSTGGSLIRKHSAIGLGNAKVTNWDAPDRFPGRRFRRRRSSRRRRSPRLRNLPARRGQRRRWPHGWGGSPRGRNRSARLG